MRYPKDERDLVIFLTVHLVTFDPWAHLISKIGAEEMFKTEEGMVACMMRMSKESGPAWLLRGIGKNWVAVAAPIASTIFLTDRCRNGGLPKFLRF